MNSPVNKGFDRQAEVEQLLEKDETVLGRFWRYEQEGLTAEEMQQKEETQTKGWTYNARSLLRVLLNGEIPASPALSQQGARRVRSWLKLPDLSPELREALEKQEVSLAARAESREAQEEEVEQAVERTEAAVESTGPGIYVYTLPHYLNYPYDQARGQTLLKVGHSSKDAYYRVKSQGRLTALPEDPVLLRIYPTEASSEAESEFHGWLRDAGQAAERTRRGGSEWFLTKIDFLDRIARNAGLEIVEVNDYLLGDT